MLYSDQCQVKLDGRTVCITGANTGIGKVTAQDLSARGARVLILCRNVEKAEEAAKEIRTKTGGEVVVYKLDLSSLKSVRECAAELNSTEAKIDILVNNAGVMTCPNWKTEDGFDMQFGTNHLGHFLLTELLMPLINKSVETGFHPRIVNVSSSAHEWGSINWDDINFEKSYDKIKAYAQSKLANVMHAKELAKRLEGTGITTYSLHPGAIATELQRHGSGWWGAILSLGRVFFKTPEQGAQTTIYCALEPSLESESGKYYVDRKEKRPNEKALIEEDQKKLWKISEEMVGLNKE